MRSAPGSAESKQQQQQNAEDEDDGLYSDNDAEAKDGKVESTSAEAAKEGGLGPLPAGWEEATDEDGDTYYINHIDETVGDQKHARRVAPPRPRQTARATAPPPVTR